MSGSITALTAAEVADRIEYLGLVPIDSVTEELAARRQFALGFVSRARAEDVTVFTRDLALLLRAGARIDDALELLAIDSDVGGLRPTVVKVRASVLAGESLGEALARHPALFPAMYVALVRVGEASGTLDRILEALSQERNRAEALRGKVAEALRYPAFVLFGAGCVLSFFLLFVLPQFASVLRDFGAKLDPIVETFLGLSDLLRAHTTAAGISLIVIIASTWYLLKRPGIRNGAISMLSRLPLIRTIMTFHRTALFCRNLGVLLGSGVTLTAALRILVDMMGAGGTLAVWTGTADRVRHGGRLSDALAETAVLPKLAVRMIRLGEETGQLPMLAARVADFYEAKLQRSLDRVVAVIGPAAIILISVVVGGLIVSIMTALLSVSQIVG